MTMRSVLCRFANSRFVLMTFACLLCFSALVYAQTGGEGSIQGTVTDPTGAVVRRAEVSATLVNTGETNTQKTTGAGFFSLTALKPGVYTVTIVAPGFERYVQENVRLDALQVQGLNVHLQVGGATETVTISTAPPPLNTTNATLGNTMENETYEALPLNMGGAPRDPTAFVYLTPGVATSPGYGSFNGGQGFLNEVYIEGIAVTNAAAAGGGNTSSVNRGASVDAIDQFQVQTAGSSAAYQGQGLENYTLKSGTNEFHGRAFEYFRNTVLDTWGYFSKAQINPATGTPSKPVERQNEFGGTFGGPIIHKKLFFFFSYDGQRYLKGSNPTLVSVATVAERNGDFRAFGQPIFDPTSTVCNAARNSCQRKQFVSDGSNGIPAGTPNVIPASRFSQISVFYQNFLPLPSNSNPTNNYLAGFNTGFTYSKYSVKVDYDLTQRNRLTFLFLTGRRDANPACCDGAGLPLPFTNTVGNFQKLPTGVIEDTYTINDHFVNQFKYAVTRSTALSINPALGTAYAATAAGITNIPAGQASDAAPPISFSGNNSPLSLSGNDRSSYTGSTNYILYDTMQLVKGRHSMSFGGQYEWLNDNLNNVLKGTSLSLGYGSGQTANFTQSKGVNTSTTDSTTGAAYASFLLGAVASASLTDNRPAVDIGARYFNFSPFFQDDVKVSRRLTMNLGLRWDLYSNFREVLNRVSFLDPKQLNPVTGTPGALAFAGSGPSGCNCTFPVHPWYKNFGPHVGFAYTATSGTVIRGAFDIAYAHTGGVGGRNGANNGTGQLGFTGGGSYGSLNGYDPAFYLNQTNTAIPSYTPPPNINASYGTGYTTTPGYTGTGNGSIGFADPYLSRRAPYYENFNIGIQQQMNKQTVLSVDYSGSNGRFLATSEGRGVYSDQLDPAYYVLGNLLSAPANAANIAAAQAFLPSYKLPFANFSPSATIGQSLRPFPQYPGINDSYGDIGKSSYNSLQVSLSQKPVGDLSYTFNYTWSKLFDDTGTGRTAYNHRYERSLGLIDVPQNISAYFVYAEPFGKGPRFYDKVIKGFFLSGIYHYNSGNPLAVTGSGCVTFAAGTCEPYLNPAFAGPIRINGRYGQGLTGANTTIPYVDVNAFLAPKVVQTSFPYTFGNAPRTAPFGLRGPNSYDVDMSLRRAFGIYEKLKLTMQIDAFNIDNHTQFASPNVSLGASNFGTVSSTGNASRDLQISARLDF